MKVLEFRKLNASDIECRIGNVAKDGSGFFLLLYKTARVDANILDEKVGQFNWAKKFYQVKNTMICSIGIKNEETGEWVWKDDAGDDDFQAEQIKGEASDSFKRAGFAWGIGRELYNSPKIYVKTSDTNTNKSYYSVSKVEFDSKKQFVELEIINDKTKEIVFSYKNGRKVAQTSQNAPRIGENEPRGSIDREDLDNINKFLSMASETSRNNFYAWIDKNFGTMNPETLTLSQGKATLNKILGRK